MSVREQISRRTSSDRARRIPTHFSAQLSYQYKYLSKRRLSNPGLAACAKAIGTTRDASMLIPLPDHFECATASSPLPKHRPPGSDSIQTDLGSVSASARTSIPARPESEPAAIRTFSVGSKIVVTFALCLWYHRFDAVVLVLGSRASRDGGPRRSGHLDSSSAIKRYRMATRL
jgi:hypothetical protein